ncbi:hypothetical protein [Mollivirus kamchatka]|nr:hypothetical protein [Mollivirus kamchatka]
MSSSTARTRQSPSPPATVPKTPPSTVASTAANPKVVLPVEAVPIASSSSQPPSEVGLLQRCMRKLDPSARGAKGGSFLGWLVPVLAVAVLAVGLVLLCFALAKSSTEQRRLDAMEKTMCGLVSKSARDMMLSAQDSNPTLAVLHANSALTQAQVVQRFMPPALVAKRTGVDIDELVEALQAQQLHAMRSLYAACPASQPEGVFAAATGWIE